MKKNLFYLLAFVVALLLFPNKFPPSANWFIFLGLPGAAVILFLIYLARRK